MSKLNKLKMVLSSLVLIHPFLSKASQPETSNKGQRNLLVFVADDLACNELGCYGGKNAQTPNIDRFVREGVLFNRMYSSSTMCSPTRASIYTGLYPVHNGVYKNHGNTKPTVKSVATYLTRMGYRVGITGKTDVRPKSVYSFEIIKGFEPNCVRKTANYTTGGISEFIDRDKNQPFCLFVCSTLPHAPWTVGNPKKFNPEKLILPPHFVDNKETRVAFSKYLAEVEALDKQFGDVLDVLKNLKKEDNTLVIFSGEQGPQFPGGKWTSWDYGQKSAFIVKSPEKYLKGKTTTALVQYEDVLPTLIDYIGGIVPRGLDGKSFLPVLEGKRKDHRKWVYGVHNNVPEGTPYPIRSIRNEKYKLIVNLTPEATYFEKHLMSPKKINYWDSWVRDSKNNEVAKHWVDRYLKRPAIEFYDTAEDPWELHNLASDRKMKPIIDKMQKKLFKWMDQQGDTGKNLDVE